MEQKTSTDIWQPLSFACVLIIGMLLGYKLATHSNIQSFGASSSSHLDDLIKLISVKYVDTIDEAKLNRGGIDGILKSLDPHTVYIPADEIDRVNEELEGTFYGIGIEFYLLNDTVIISGIISGGPSENKNIVPGNKLIKIDDSIIAGKNLQEEDIIKRIRGQRKSNLTLTLIDFNGIEKEIEILRGSVPVKSVPAFFKINEETGFIKISLFGETTFDEFKKALYSLVTRRIKKLIIDVRDNPGGYMDAVAKVADELVAGKHTIVSTKGKQKTDSLTTHIIGLFEQGNLCILVDENSASASEILAGSIQDLDRGLIVGRRTYGKGLVQEQFQLPDHSAIRITTARYYLPSGRCIQRSYASGNENYRHDIIDRFTNGEMQQGDTSIKKSKKYFTTKNKVVYGDEGISPDVFVPLDTIYYNQLNDYYTKHIAEEFALRYYFFHKNEFEKYNSLDAFSNKFSISNNMQIEIGSLLLKHKINIDILKNTILYKEIMSTLKTEFAKLLFGNNGYYKEYYKDDEFVLKALNAMK